MVTKTKAPATTRRAPRKRTSAAANPVSDAMPEPQKQGLIRAGLHALDKARQDVAERQSRVFEAILGFEPAQGLSALAGAESAAAKVATEALGLRKFEAVFDQRVAHALERMGLPSAEALNALVDEVAALASEVAALRQEVQVLKAAPRRR